MPQTVFSIGVVLGHFDRDHKLAFGNFILEFEDCRVILPGFRRNGPTVAIIRDLAVDRGRDIVAALAETAKAAKITRIVDAFIFILVYVSI